MSAYYNENDPCAAQWLRELIRAGEIPDGVVDERSICDVQPADVAEFVQCHFFAGIGGWSLALKLAGWPEDRPVWTGSCPCQPYSAAGRQKGNADKRNLWPAFFKLIAACQPEFIFGEQVEAAVRHGWIDGVFADLEGKSYTCGSAVLGAHSFGAPHIRQRLYWMAHTSTERWKRRQNSSQSISKNKTKRGEGMPNIECSGNNGGLAHAGSERRQQVTTGTSGNEGENGRQPNADHIVTSDGENSRVADPNGGQSSDGELQRGGRQLQQPKDEAVSGLEHTASDGREQLWAESGERSIKRGCGDSGVDNSTGNGAKHGQLPAKPGGDRTHHGLSRPSGDWDNYEFIPCLDGKARRIESGTFPLAHGIPGRVGLLRGYGNAIVPQVAAEFIKAFIECS